MPAAVFEIDATTGEVTLATGQSLDYETATSHNITIRSTDGTNATDPELHGQPDRRHLRGRRGAGHG